jgi:hypothetical protein
MPIPIARSFIALVLALVVSPFVAAQPSNAPPPEARQFDFLIGEWTVAVEINATSLAARIHGAPKLSGTWRAQRAFDGAGIDDELRLVDGSGNPVSFARTQRIYSSVEKVWLVSVLDVYRTRFSIGRGEWRDERMQLMGSGINDARQPYLTRTIFDEIGADGFRMRQDRSFDGGDTWDEAVLTIIATRAAK